MLDFGSALNQETGVEGGVGVLTQLTTAGRQGGLDARESVRPGNTQDPYYPRVRQFLVPFTRHPAPPTPPNFLYV